MRVRTSERARIEYTDEGILCFRYPNGAFVDLEFASAVVEEARELLDGDGPAPTLVEPGDITELTRDARIFFATSPENSAVSSRVALLVGSMGARIIGNLYMRVGRPEIPTRLFTDRDAALAWLLAPEP